MKKIRKRIAEAVLFALCLCALAIPASAYSRVDTAKQIDLVLRYQDVKLKKPIKGLPVRLYKVADMSDAVEFTAQPWVTEASVALDSDALRADANWAQSAAQTLAGYAKKNAASESVQAALMSGAEQTTDSNGDLLVEDLSAGLYLVLGASTSCNGYKYTTSSYLLTLPLLDKETDQWDYGTTPYTVMAEGQDDRELEVLLVSHDAKYSRSGSNKPDGSSTSITVVKKWADGTGEARPSSVTISLTNGGEVVDTVTLSAANGWKKSWTNLDASGDWDVVEEDVPEEYTVLVDKNATSSKITFTVTNTKGDIPTTPPKEPDNPDGSNDPNDPLIDIPDDDIPLLPQTGMLWWPVSLLAAAGMLLFAAGWALNLREKKGRRDA